jgi:NAD-dependent SIR2 family protein deacetylase
MTGLVHVAQCPICHEKLYWVDLPESTRPFPERCPYCHTVFTPAERDLLRERAAGFDLPAE